MEDNFMQYMKVVAGENQQKTNEKKLSEKDKQKISSAYFQLFYNISFSNWLKGMTLGEAWYRAINKMKTFIASKSPENPATMYLRQIFSAHKTKWAQLIMTSPEKDTVIECSPEKKQEWMARIGTSINKNLTEINNTAGNYEPDKKQEYKNQNGFSAGQQTMQMLIMWQMQNQNQRTRYK